jgi:hypothetical protein
MQDVYVLILLWITGCMHNGFVECHDTGVSVDKRGKKENSQPLISRRCKSITSLRENRDLVRYDDE